MWIVTEIWVHSHSRAGVVTTTLFEEPDFRRVYQSSAIWIHICVSKLVEKIDVHNLYEIRCALNDIHLFFCPRPQCFAVSQCLVDAPDHHLPAVIYFLFRRRGEVTGFELPPQRHHDLHESLADNFLVSVQTTSAELLSFNHKWLLLGIIGL